MDHRVPATTFFTVLVRGFSKKLEMPSAFVINYDGPKLCTLQGPTRESWNVKLKEEDDAVFFRKGWSKFAKENFLDEGDFLVFNYDGDSCFEVTIYDESACEMDMEEAKIKRSDIAQIRDHAAAEGSRIVEFSSESFCFKRSMKHHRRCQLNILMSIVRGVPLPISEQILELVDPRNRSWTVTARLMPDGRLLINNGWRGCCRANQIEEGQTFVFEFVEEHVKLHIFRAKECNVVLTGPNVVG